MKPIRLRAPGDPLNADGSDLGRGSATTSTRTGADTRSARRAARASTNRVSDQAVAAPPRCLSKTDESESSIIGRTFLILSAFREDFVLGVSELSRRTGLPRTTVHRIANQLLEVGALSRVGTKFRIGPSLFELGNLHYPQRLRDKLQPLLDDLQRMTDGNVSLLELVGTDVIVIAASRPRRSRCGLTHLGQRFPAHACAGGQVILASEQRSMPPLTSVTPDTIVDEVKFRRRLIDIRAAGLGFEHSEAEVGWTTLAIPAVNRHGRTLGAIMLKAETESLDLDTMISTLRSFGQTFTAAGQQAAVGFFASARPRPKDPAS